MTRLHLTLLLAAAVVLVIAPDADAYGHLGEQVGSQVLEKHWPTSLFPIALTVDGGPTDLTSEIATAATTWNAVPTALNPWGTVTHSTTDFKKANFGTAWGDLSGDGKHEVVVDEDGSILRSFGLVPSSVNGFGESGGVIHNGEAEINDMYLLLNGSRSDFDRQSTEVHELGHTLGLAHSSVGFAVGKDGSPDPQLQAEVPTMHPFAINTTDRQTLETDDVASLSTSYPTASFATSFGTISGVVTRCSGEPVLGANVRAIDVSNPAIQLSRVTGFDGKTDGSYTIEGVPPGEYDVVVEPMGGDDDFLLSLPLYTRVDTDFTAEFHDANEGDCALDTDPTAKDGIQVGATGNAGADFKVEGASLAFAIDVTGSMGPELQAMKVGLDAIISGIEAAGSAFPKTAIVTFDDASQLKIVSRDPDKLRDVINNLTTHSTLDCPEGSNRALMTAGRQLGAGGVAILVTDADSHRTGPTREAVEDFYSSKGAHLNTMLSGSCPPEQNPQPFRPRSASLAPAPIPGAGPDQAQPVRTLGVENAVRTFSEESLFTGGLFSFQPEVKNGSDADAQTHYENTLTNLGISAVLPTVAAVQPATVPEGTALDVELTGSHTGFHAGSTVAVAGGGVTASAVRVLSPTRIVVHLAATAGAPTGFRDVTVTTGAEIAKGIGAVEVTAAPSGPAILSVTPSTGGAGATENVTISGALSHFGPGSVAAFGDRVDVNHLTVLSPTVASANVSIAPGAKLAFRTVTVTTGSEAPARANAFLVTSPTPANPRLTGASPRSGTRGSAVDVTLTGADTAFAGGASVTSVTGSGVQALSTMVRSPTSAVAHLKIASDAPLGLRDLRVTTGTQRAVLVHGFEVRALPTCADQAPPTAALLKGKAGARARHRRLQLHGSAHDDGCAAPIPVVGKVALVEVAISRKAGTKCRFVKGSGKLTTARRCSRPVLLKANGTTTWGLTTKRKLPKGRYAIVVRVTDAAGNATAAAAKRKVRVK